MSERTDRERLVEHANIGVWTETPGAMLFIDKWRGGFALRFERAGEEPLVFNIASFRTDRIVAAIQAAIDAEEDTR